MKHWFLGLALALGFLLMAPVVGVRADSESGGGDSDSGVAVAPRHGGFAAPELDSTAAGSAMVLLLGGVAYVASRRRNNDVAA